MMTIEEIINILEEVKELDEFFQYNPRYLEDFNTIIETLKQEQEQKTEWIPVSEDLPTLDESEIAKSDNVLVTDGIDIYIGYLVKRAGKTSWHIYEDVDVDIIAWRPSPELCIYKTESEDEE